MAPNRSKLTTSTIPSQKKRLHKIELPEQNTSKATFFRTQNNTDRTLNFRKHNQNSYLRAPHFSFLLDKTTHKQSSLIALLFGICISYFVPSCGNESCERVSWSCQGLFQAVTIVKAIFGTRVM